jgi:pimeloyl-ACP methyl ester carboxylesterase
MTDLASSRDKRRRAVRAAARGGEIDFYPMMNEVGSLEARGMASKQKVRFCSVAGDQRVAFSVQGKGPPAVVAPFCVSHLEQDLEEPKLRAFYDRLAERCTLVRYDHTGVGLSDRAREDFSFERELSELSAVIEALDAPRVTLLGGSFGSPVAIAYAALHPERVESLLLYGSFAWGGLVAAPEVQQAMSALVRANWGLGAKTLATLLAPHVSAEEGRRFTRTQLLSTSAETASELLSLLYRMDVRELAARVAAPTLVVHRRQDGAVPLEAGRDVAARIPGARLLMLDGDVHLPWFGALDAQEAVCEFLSEPRRMEQPSSTAESISGELIRAGDVWAVGWAGRRFHLKHAKGLSDIAMLVQNPRTPIAAIALAEGGSGADLSGSPQPLLDERARREFRQRLRELDEQLSEAAAHDDLGRRERLGAERQALICELEAAAGLGARPRNFPSAAERARKAVQARLRDALARLRQSAPELGAHLESSITTGLHCVYEPERPVRWRVDISGPA